MTGCLRDCYDFHVRSEIELPELAPAADGEDRPVVEIRLGTTPGHLPGAAPPAFGLQCSGERALLVVEEVARFLLEGSTRITVEPVRGVAPETLRLFLLGSAMGVVALRRGLLLLHANAVVLQGSAHAFLGHSGAGKSTLAGQFAKAGYGLLSDDVCAVRLADEQPPVAWPAVARLKLWRDAAEALQHSVAALAPLREGFDKFSVALPSGPAAPAVLERICVLERSDSTNECALARLTGREAMAALIEHSYRREYLSVLGLTADNFHQCAALTRKCEVFRLRRSWGLEGLERQASAIAEQFAALPRLNSSAATGSPAR